jgi:hypothetical protein
VTTNAFLKADESNLAKGSNMKKYLFAALIVAAFATPALAEQFYVAYDGKRCEMFSHKPAADMNVLGTFNSKHDAEKAMEDMKQCKH